MYLAFEALAEGRLRLTDNITVSPPAAGQQPTMTINPMEGAATITAYIVQVAMGDLPHGSIGYQSIFAAGLVLAFMTLFFNLLGHLARKKYREAY